MYLLMSSLVICFLFLDFLEANVLHISGRLAFHILRMMNDEILIVFSISQGDGHYVSVCVYLFLVGRSSF